MTQLPGSVFLIPLSIRSGHNWTWSLAQSARLSRTPYVKCRALSVPAFSSFFPSAFCPLTPCTCPTVGYPPTFSPFSLSLSLLHLYFLSSFFFFTSFSSALVGIRSLSTRSLRTTNLIKDGID